MKNNERISIGLAIALIILLICIGSVSPSLAIEVPFTFQWDPNHPNDNVVAYRIYWSNTSGSFNTVDREEIPVSSLTDPNNPEWTITPNLANENDKVYFVATAVDDEGFESDYSNQVHSSSVSISEDFQEGFNVVASNHTGFVFYGEANPSVSVSFYISGGAHLGSVFSNPDGTWSTSVNFSGVDQGAFTLIVISEGDMATIDGLLDSVAPLFDVVPIDTARTQNSATIEWKTSESTKSRIEYSAIQGNPAPMILEDNDLKEIHLMTLTALEENTTIYYTVIATDVVDNVLTSVENTLTTASDVTPPVIDPPNWIDKSDTTATISWALNETCDSVLRYGTASTGGSWAALPFVAPVDLGSGTRTVTLTGLTPNQTYYYMVRATDIAGNWSESAEKTIVTNVVQDVNNPVITQIPVAVSITDTSVKILWQTDELADSVVEYGLSIEYGSTHSTVGLTADHSVMLTGLNPETTYHFLVSSTDEYDNGPTFSGDYTFTTPVAPDTDNPVIISVPTVVEFDSTTASITWSTDELSNSQVRYGLVDVNWSDFPLTANGSEMVTDHQVTLSGLSDGETYYFQVGSTDGSGNGPTVSFTNSFTTAQEPDISAPELIAPPTVVGKTENSATIEWTTDEPAGSTVQYGLTSGVWGSYETAKNDNDIVNSHTIQLTNLAADSTYYFRVGSSDAADNGPTVSNEFSFQTDATVDDTRPRIVSPPTVVSKTDTTATVVWETDEPANSEVRYDSSKSKWDGYAYKAIEFEMTTVHSVTLINLSAETRYYFRVGSTDAAENSPNPSPQEKNNPFSEDNFTTEPAADTTAPEIIEEPEVTQTDSTTATVEWTTDEPSNTKIAPGRLKKDHSLANVEDHPSAMGSSEMVTQHSVTLTGLSSSTTYEFVVDSTDIAGNGPERNANSSNPSKVITFTTNVEKDQSAPVISGVTMSFATNSTALIKWTTDEPSNSMVHYGLVSSEWDGYAYSEYDAEMTTAHSITITGLQPMTEYFFRIASTDAKGNGPDYNSNDSNPSAEQSFVSESGPDVSAPQVANNVTIVPKPSEGKAVINWETDEPGNSQVQYDISSSGWGSYTYSENDAEMVRSHSVTLTGLERDTLYFIRVVSVDAAGNNYETSDIDDNPSIEYEMILETPVTTETISADEEKRAEGSCFIRIVNDVF